MERILKDMEQRINALKSLESLMKGMTDTISKFKTELSAIEFNINDAKLDAWTQNIFNYLVDIAREDGLSVGTVGTVKSRVYIDMKEVKKGLADRGVEFSVKAKSEPIVKNFLNEMISLGLDFITSKELARQKYREIEKDFKEKIKKIKK